MAPSRALIFRRITSALARPHTPRPTPRLLSTSAANTQSIHRPLSLQARFQRAPAPSCTRSYSQPATAAPEPPEYLNEAELHIFNKIKAELEPAALEVQDISGGCGSMYAIQIESPKFKGLTVIKQHKMVNQVLKEEIAKWHGVQLRTKAT